MSFVPFFNKGLNGGDIMIDCYYARFNIGSTPVPQYMKIRCHSSVIGKKCNLLKFLVKDNEYKLPYHIKLVMYVMGKIYDNTYEQINKFDREEEEESEENFSKEEIVQLFDLITAIRMDQGNKLKAHLADKFKTYINHNNWSILFRQFHNSTTFDELNSVVTDYISDVLLNEDSIIDVDPFSSIFELILKEKLMEIMREKIYLCNQTNKQLRNQLRKH